VARAVFFTRDLVALEEAADRATLKRQALLALAITQSLDGDFGRALEQNHARRLIGINPITLAIAGPQALGCASLCSRLRVRRRLTLLTL